MADVTRKRVVRLGVIMAAVLAMAALSVPALCGDAKDKDAEAKPSTEAPSAKAPSAKAEDKEPGDFWIDLKKKPGKDAGRSIEAEIEELVERMEAFEKRMDEMMGRVREMERGVPHRWQLPRMRDFDDWGRPQDIDEWLKELEREFRLIPGKEPFRFQLQMMRPGDVFFKLRMDTEETEDAYVFRLDAPGMNKDDIIVEINDHVLTVSGERKEQVKEEERDGKTVRREINYGRFERKIELPQDADTDTVSSKYADGVLTITVPKKEKEEAEGKRIIIHRP